MRTIAAKNAIPSRMWKQLVGPVGEMGEFVVVNGSEMESDGNRWKVRRPGSLAVVLRRRGLRFEKKGPRDSVFSRSREFETRAGALIGLAFSSPAQAPRPRRRLELAISRSSTTASSGPSWRRMPVVYSWISTTADALRRGFGAMKD
jgi:hypothetical protein